MSDEELEQEKAALKQLLERARRQMEAEEWALLHGTIQQATRVSFRIYMATDE